MTSVIALFIELLLDIVGLVTGIIVLRRSLESGLRRAWGMLATALSLLLLCDNLEWMWLFSQGTERMPFFVDVPMDHLSVWHMVRTVIFFQLFSLFPIASLKPGWMNSSRILNMLIPVLLITCITCCYQFFNGHYTELNSFAAIGENIGEQDVQVRLLLFIISVLAPSINFLLPFLGKWIPLRRRQSRGMYIYMGCFALIMSGYIWLMLGTCGLCFNLFGYFVISPTVFLNILYLRNDNPLSLPPFPVDKMNEEEINTIKEIAVSPVILELSEHLQTIMTESAPFVNSQYSLQDLLQDLKTNEHRLSKVLRYNGFSGFRDYISFKRLQYFKEQAALRKELTVKELMFMSGFTSRSSFYRYFASIENMSPSEYLDKIRGKE